MPPPYAKVDESGWLREIHQLSDYNFARLLPKDLKGFPVYFNGKEVWPQPADGISVIWSEIGVGEEHGAPIQFEAC